MNDTAKEKLEKWFKEEKATKNLVDIKFYPGDTSKANVENFCESVLKMISAKAQGNFERLAESS